MKMGTTTEIPGLFKTKDGYAIRLRVRHGSLIIGKRKKLSGASKLEALHELEKLRAEATEELDRSLRGEESSQTLTVFARRWMKELSARRASGEIAAKTVRSYAFFLERFILPHLGRMDVHDLKAKDVKAWMAGLGDMRMPAIRRGRGEKTYKQEARPYSRRSLLGAWGTLRSFCGWLSVEADLVKNPARDIRFTVNAPGPRSKATLSQDELARLLNAAALDSDRNVRMFLLVFLSGALRASELSALTRDDVDLEKGTITISRSYVQGHIGKPKTEGSRRTVILPPEVVEELKAFIAWQDETKAKGIPILFPTSRGTHRQPASFKGPLARCAKRAGIEKHLTSHVMRRTANNLIRKSSGELVARAVTGHTTQEMTEHYSEVDHEERTRALRAAFGPALGGATS